MPSAHTGGGRNQIMIQVQNLRTFVRKRKPYGQVKQL